jgi:hypothetical protein
MSSNTYTTYSAASWTTANSLSVTTANLTVSRNSNFSDTNVVKGGSTVKIGSFTITAGGAEDISVSSINVDVYQAGALSVAGVSKLSIRDNADSSGTDMASTNSPSATTGGNNFSVSGKVNITKSTTKIIDIYATITTAAGASIMARIPVNGISAVGKTSSTSLSSVPSTEVQGQTITLGNGGVLTISTDTSATSSAKILHSSDSSDILSVKLAADNNEDIKLDKLYVTIKD